jgi:hypothetical protein
VLEPRGNFLSSLDWVYPTTVQFAIRPSFVGADFPSSGISFSFILFLLQFSICFLLLNSFHVDLPFIFPSHFGSSAVNSK